MEPGCGHSQMNEFTIVQGWVQANSARSANASPQVEPLMLRAHYGEPAGGGEVARGQRPRASKLHSVSHGWA